MALNLIPYLVMNGNANEAINFYKEVLGAEVLFLQTFGEGPEHPEFSLPEEAKGLVLHASVKIGESTLMFSDAFPGYPHQSGNQVTICISSNDIEKSRQIFEGLSQGGTVEMPLQDTFFSPAYGKVVDKFGVLFQVFTDSPQQ